MKKLVLAAIATVALTAPGFAAMMHIDKYPRNLAELEYCAKMQMSGGEVPDGCKTLGQRIVDRLADMK